MNALTKYAPEEQHEVVRVLQNSLYPGAKPESVELVLSYCRVQQIDPFLKPVHIVPTWDSKSRSMRDVLMPGIADYRIKAARSQLYAGKGEPEFGPDVTRTWTHTDRNGVPSEVTVTFPAWCKVTVEKIVAGQARQFAAKELWLENYATAGRDSEAPNTMWRKRPYGQLAKCAEAQALRMAFPELAGGAPTAEEMEGKEMDMGGAPTIEGRAERVSRPAPRQQPTTAALLNDSIPALEEPQPQDKARAWTDGLLARIRATDDEEALIQIVRDRKIDAAREKLRQNRPELDKEIADALGEAHMRLSGVVDVDGVDGDEPDAEAA